MYTCAASFFGRTSVSVCAPRHVSTPATFTGFSMFVMSKMRMPRKFGDGFPELFGPQLARPEVSTPTNSRFL